jgi:CRISPR system Cascade subunit CasE
MNGALYLSRVRLRAGRGEALSAIGPALLAGSKGDVVGNAHRILWMLFQEPEDGEARDFLWREERPGEYLVLSRREPSNSHGLFEIGTKDFSPQLKSGDRLAFVLRANPVISRKGEGSGKSSRGKRCDIVMNALHPLGRKAPSDVRGESARAKARDELTQKSAETWLAAQGERHGFKLVADPEREGKPYLTAANYETVRIPRMKDGDRLKDAIFGVLDLAGLIEICDPAAFTARLPQGFGKAKAFGCGLMLIRRAA